MYFPTQGEPTQEEVCAGRISWTAEEVTERLMEERPVTLEEAQKVVQAIGHDPGKFLILWISHLRTSCMLNMASSFQVKVIGQQPPGYHTYSFLRRYYWQLTFSPYAWRTPTGPLRNLRGSSLTDWECQQM